MFVSSCVFLLFILLLFSFLSFCGTSSQNIDGGRREEEEKLFLRSFLSFNNINSYILCMQIYVYIFMSMHTHTHTHTTYNRQKDKYARMKSGYVQGYVYATLRNYGTHELIVLFNGRNQMKFLLAKWENLGTSQLFFLPSFPLLKSPKHGMFSGFRQKGSVIIFVKFISIQAPNNI